MKIGILTSKHIAITGMTFAVLAVGSVEASADTLTLPAIQRGWIDSTNRINGTSSTNNYLAGFVPGVGEVRNFFGFSIPTLSEPIDSAVFTISTGGVSLSQSPTATVNFTSFDNSIVGTAARFAALGTGTPYGSFTYSASDAGGVESISLSAAAIAAIEADQGGTFFISSRIPGLAFINQNVYGLTMGTNFVTQLELTEVPSEIPLPPALYLFGSVLGGAFWMSRRKRSAAPRGLAEA